MLAADVIVALQSAGLALRGGLGVAKQGLNLLKEGYDVAAPVIKRGVDAVAPVVQDAIKVTTDVAGPVVTKAVPTVQVRAVALEQFPTAASECA